MQTSIDHIRPRVSQLINDNCCENVPSSSWLTRSKEIVKFISLWQLHRIGPDNLNNQTVNLVQCHQTGSVSRETLKCVNSVVLNHVHIVKGKPQKRGVNPNVVRPESLKYVNNVSCVD